MNKLAKITGLILLGFFIFSGLSTAQGSSSEIDFEVRQIEPSPLQAGEYATVWVRATNTGGTAVDNLEIDLKDNFPFTPSDKSQWSPRDGLEAGESFDMRLEMRVGDNAVFGENDILLEYTGDSGVSVTEELPVEVRTDDRSLVISELDFPERVPPGSSSQLNLTLENRENSYFRNVDVSLDLDELPVAPRDTSRKRLDEIGPESSENLSFMLDVDPDADNELYQLPISIDYENQAGQEFSVSEVTGVNVGGYPGLEVGIDESDIRSSGKGAVTFRVVNGGEGEARFTQMTLEESSQYEILSENSVYLGSMIDDDYQTAEFELFVEESNGTLELPVQLEYTDGEGEKTETFTVERQLYTQEELDRYNGTGSGSVLPLIIAVILVAGGVFYWRRRRRD